MTDLLWERRLKVTGIQTNPVDRSAWIRAEGFKGMDAYNIKEGDNLYLFTETEIHESECRYDDLWRRFLDTREQCAGYKRHFKELKILMEDEE